MKKDEISIDQAFGMMQKDAGFNIIEYNSHMELKDDSRFTKLNTNSGQKMQLSAFLHQMPQVLATGTLSRAYVAKFPFGLHHTLTALNQGGYGSMIRINGKFAGSASFYPVASQAAALGAFTAMSAVTSQYFLAQINSELKIVNDKLEDILSFLYGEKRAELIAEIEFIKFAHANFASITSHEQQRLATIQSIQNARIVASKDIEFYLLDIENIAAKGVRDYSDLCVQTQNAYRAKSCIEMACQLYIISGLLELYYAQNYDKNYISYIEQEMIGCINKCDSRINSSMSVIQGKHRGYKAKPLEKVENREKNIQKIENDLTQYKNEKDSKIRVALKESLNSLNKEETYYIDSDGAVYVKKE